MNSYRLTYSGPSWRSELASRLADPEALFADAQCTVLKRGTKRAVARFSVGEELFVVKLFDETPLRYRLGRLVRASAARRAFEGSKRLKEVGFAAPEVVAVMERGPRWAPSGGCVVTRWIAAPVLNNAWESLGREERMRFAGQLGAYARELHEAGVYPQDLQSLNLLVQSSGDEWTFVLADVDRVRRYRNLSWARRRKNLVHLQRSLGVVARRRERLHFLMEYLGPGGSRAEHLRIVNEVLTASADADIVAARRIAKRLRRDQRRLASQ